MCGGKERVVLLISKSYQVQTGGSSSKGEGPHDRGERLNFLVENEEHEKIKELETTNED